ncbi:hypothetical protein, partial [Stenotrophomonas maltophilia]
GAFIAATSDRGLVAFEFAEPGPSPVRALEDRFANSQVIEDTADLAGTIGKLTEVIDHPDRDPGLALDPRGTD